MPVSREDIAHLVSAASKEHQVPEDLIYAIMGAENSGSPKTAAGRTSYNPDAVSPAGARGIMQVMPSAIQQAYQSGFIPPDRKIDLSNLKDQIDVGTAYIRYAMGLSQDPQTIAAIYNAGPKARNMKILPAETQQYQKKFAAAYSGAPISAPSQENPTKSFSAGANMDSQDIVSQIMNGGMTTSQGIRAGVQNQQQLDAGITDLESLAQQQRTLAVQQASSVAGLQADIQFQRDSLIEKTQAMLGLNPDDMNNFVAQSMSQLNTASGAREAAIPKYAEARGEYDKLATTDLLSDPLGFVMAQFQLPGAAARVNAAAGEVNMAEAEEQHAAQQLQTRLQLMSAAKSTMVANTSKAAQEANLLQAQASVSEAKAKLNEQEAKNLGAQGARTMQQLNLLATAERLDDEDEARKDRASARKFKADKDLDEKQQIDQWNSRLKGVSDALGLADPMTYEKLKGLANAKEKEFWLQAMNSGTFGDNMEEAVTNFSRRANRMNLQKTNGMAQLQTADKILGVVSSLKNRIAQQVRATTGKAPTQEEAWRQAFQEYQAEVEASVSVPSQNDMSSSYWDDKARYNPYKINLPSLNKAIEISAQQGDKSALGLTKNPVYKYVQAQITSGGLNGQDLTAEQQRAILSAFIVDVGTRKLTSAQAASAITEYFRAGTAFQAKSSSAVVFGLPQAQSYYFTLDGSWRPGDNQSSIDLLNPAQVENILAKKARMRYSAGSQIFLGDPEDDNMAKSGRGAWSR